MAPPPPPALKEDEILAMLCDEDDDDLGLLSASDEEGEDEEDRVPPDIVEVLNESGDLVVLPFEDIERYSVAAAPFDILPEHSDQDLVPPDGLRVIVTPPPPEELEGVILTPPPAELSRVSSPALQE
jgi:hypothetical protein